MSTIFKKIIDKEIPVDLIYEDDLCMAFKDINPQAPVHVLVIPRKEIPSLAEAQKEDQSLIGHIFLKACEIAKNLNLANGYRLVVNTKKDGGQTVDHLHVHILGGRQMKWPPG